MRSRTRHRAVLVTVGVALVGGAAVAGAAGVQHSEPAKHGRLKGALYYEGGPAPTPGRRAVDTYKEPGVASVYRDGRLVARRRVRGGYDFLFTLPPGTYKAVDGRSLHNPACPARFIRVRNGVTTHIKLYCSVE